MDRKDWHDDAALTERSAALSPLRRRQAAALALWRWHAPLFAFEWDPDWGIDLAVLESLFQAAASAPGEQSDRQYRQAIAELFRAPLFTFEVDVEDSRERVQLETMEMLEVFGAALEEPSPHTIERVIDFPRGLAHYVDRHLEDSFYDHPWENVHGEYLASLTDPVRSYGLGYAASRNLTVEQACHNALHTLPPTEGLLDSPAGLELIALCEDLGEELIAMLRWIRSTGY